jgi:hypothetical protein
VGNNVTWSGQALSYGGTVTTDTDTITLPSCGVSAPATLHIVKIVNNTNSGTATSADFNINVKLSNTDVSGSPASGMANPGTLYLLAPGSYVVSEAATANYTTSFSASCLGGNVTLNSGDDTICTITNSDIAPEIIPPVVRRSSSGSSGGGTHYGCKDLNATNYEYFAASNPALCIYTSTSTIPVAIPTVATTTLVNYVTVITPAVISPIFPNAGISPERKNIFDGAINFLKNICAQIFSQ